MFITVRKLIVKKMMFTRFVKKQPNYRWMTPILVPSQVYGRSDLSVLVYDWEHSRLVHNISLVNWSDIKQRSRHLLPWIKYPNKTLNLLFCIHFTSHVGDRMSLPNPSEAMVIITVNIIFFILPVKKVTLEKEV